MDQPHHMVTLIQNIRYYHEDMGRCIEVVIGQLVIILYDIRYVFYTANLKFNYNLRDWKTFNKTFYINVYVLTFLLLLLVDESLWD